MNWCNRNHVLVSCGLVHFVLMYCMWTCLPCNVRVYFVVVKFLLVYCELVNWKYALCNSVLCSGVPYILMFTGELCTGCFVLVYFVLVNSLLCSDVLYTVVMAENTVEVSVILCSCQMSDWCYKSGRTLWQRVTYLLWLAGICYCRYYL